MKLIIVFKFSWVLCEQKKQIIVFKISWVLYEQKNPEETIVRKARNLHETDAPETCHGQNSATKARSAGAKLAVTNLGSQKFNFF